MKVATVHETVMYDPKNVVSLYQAIHTSSATLVSLNELAQTDASVASPHRVIVVPLIDHTLA